MLYKVDFRLEINFHFLLNASYLINEEKLISWLLFLNFKKKIVVSKD